ncbi:glycosyltransferase family 4 protein [Mycobacterium barrassiae]|uniref:glycosyltransferase n=1 Tax=Mycobacterium barrassiae TaxID=319709 RepID=UPI002265B762|nr:glycosyltransferase [Mycobacterium barrassiae]MCV7302821.1 glycosyltransferase family 4 protein [Mycobacterium barrassiae]
MNSPRVLWLSPWMRSLARVQTEALLRQGADVLLVTSDQHPESDAARDYELVLEPRFKKAATWIPTLKALRRVREYRPDVVITELVRDPRWMMFAGRTPRIQVIHDDRAHDPDEEVPAYERAVFDRFGARSAATVTYSRYVAQAVAGRRDVAGTQIWVAPLPSDLDPERVPPWVDASGRADFVMFGRLNPYKNLDVVLKAWDQHVGGGRWRGDNLVLMGDGQIEAGALPDYTRWRQGNYRYTEVVSTLAAAKGSVAHYRRASQSGVQVLSMQLGVMPIVSTAGALPEYQPPGCPPVGVDDVAGLAATFDLLADPVIAAQSGDAAARHYSQLYAAEHGARRFLEVIAQVVARRR